jgi:hypothetical protein
MNRLAALIALLAATAANTCLAEDPAFCKSMCASEQRSCHADAQLQPKEERLMPSDTPDKNPFARASQGEIQSSSSRALGASGDTNRRMARSSACATRYQACMRSCAQPNNAKDGNDADKPKKQPIQFG